MLVGIYSLYSEEKTDTKPPPELWGSVFMAIFLQDIFLKGLGEREGRHGILLKEGEC